MFQVFKQFLKIKVDKLNVDKSVSVPVHLSKAIDAVKYAVKIIYIKLR